MMDNEIQPVRPSNGALNAEHYQTFEMAKANDTILGGDDIAQIRSYAAFARAQAQAIHKSIATMGELDDVAQAKAEMTETSQTFAKVSVYADQRIGEILRELPTKQGMRNDITSSHVGEEVTKANAIEEANISKSEAYRLEQLAANPEVVEAVIAKAEEEGKVVSRSQVLKAIKEREEAERERDAARHAEHMMHREVESMRQALAERPEPEVIEREVIPDDTKRAIRELEKSNKQYSEDYESLRQRFESTRAELQEVRRELDVDNSIRDAMHEVKMLTNATNEYVGRYSKQRWNLEGVDGQTISSLYDALCDAREFVGNVINLINEVKS